MDDATLIPRAGDGDGSAFEELVIRYQPPMFRLALRMLRHSGDAEDPVQDVFVTAWRRLAELRADTLLSAGSTGSSPTGA